jgi:hypothetical protein
VKRKIPSIILLFFIVFFCLESHAEETPQCENLPAYLKGFSSFTKDFQTCFANRKVEANANEQYDLIYQDQKVCSCLKENKILEITLDLVKAFTLKDKDALLLRDTQSNIELKVKQNQDEYAGLMVHANIIGSTNLAAQYTQPPIEDFVIVGREMIEASLQSRLQNKTSNSFAQASRVASLLRGPDSMEEIIDRIERPSECITMQGFLSYNQIPKDEHFSSIFNAEKKFNQDDWNYEMLKNRYDELLSRSPESDEVKEVKARISFLIKNPMIKSLMSAQIGDLTGHEVNNATLNQKKEDLFNIMKNKFRTHDPQSPSKLSREEYRNELTKLFMDSDVLVITRVKAEVDLVKHLLNEDEQEELLRPREANSHSTINAHFSERFPNLNLRQCSGEVKEIIGCGTAFSVYCSIIDKAVASYEKEGPTEKQSTILERKEKDMVKLDPINNQAFNDARKKWCEARLLAKDGKSSSTFEDFQNSPNCKNKSNQECLSLFISKHNPWTSEGRADEEVIPFDFSTKEITPEIAADLQKHATPAASSRSISKTSYTDRQQLAAAEAKNQAPKAKPVVAQSPPEPTIAIPDVFDPNEQVTQYSVFPSSNTMNQMAMPATKSVSSANLNPDLNSKLDPTIPPSNNSTLKELEDAKKDLAELKQQLASQSKESESSKLQKRIADLEEKLEKQDKGAPEKQGPYSIDPQKAKRAQATASAEQTKDLNNVSSTLSPSRTPAALAGDLRASGHGGDIGRASEASTAHAPLSNPSGTNAAAAKRNAALLSMFNVEVQTDTPNLIMIATEKDSQSLSRLAQESKAQTILVSKEEYDKLQSRVSYESLQTIYNNKDLKDNLSKGSVKITVTSKGEKAPLQFYAIKEDDGRVIFQPVRSAATLENLKQSLLN